MLKNDNPYWIDIKNHINRYNINDEFKIIDYNYMMCYEPREVYYIRIFRKLGYIEKTEISVSGLYKKLKHVPVDLTFKNALLLSNNLKLENNGKKRLSGSHWDNIIKTINNLNTDNFNALNIFGEKRDFRKIRWSTQICVDDILIHNTTLMYLSNLNDLGYIERLGKNRFGDYKIIKKIPNSLTVNDAHLMLYDKMWKRKRKIDRLKEKYQYNDNK